MASAISKISCCREEFLSSLRWWAASMLEPTPSGIRDLLGRACFWPLPIAYKPTEWLFIPSPLPDRPDLRLRPSDGSSRKHPRSFDECFGVQELLFFDFVTPRRPRAFKCVYAVSENSTRAYNGFGADLRSQNSADNTRHQAEVALPVNRQKPDWPRASTVRITRYPGPEHGCGLELFKRLWHFPPGLVWDPTRSLRPSAREAWASRTWGVTRGLAARWPSKFPHRNSANVSSARPVRLRR